MLEQQEATTFIKKEEEPTRYLFMAQKKSVKG